ncbi:MAG: hypothetical protein H7101_13855 [Deinococcales bacterium]|nr:hypothetical protein [Chitinophagaceae bacterium]
MIIYNKNWLLNKGIHEQITTAFKQHLITKEEKETLLNNYPIGFYSPNYFIRIGLGVLTLMVANFTLGFLGLLGSSFSENITALLLVNGVICYIGLEFMVRQNNHFSSGVDDMLLYMSSIFILCGLCYNSSFNSRFSESIIALLCFAVTILASLRFTDRLTGVAAYVAFFAFIFYSYLQLGTIAKATMPFVVMLLSVAMYILSIAIDKNPRWIHYHDCLSMIKILSLITFYAGGNYYVIRELSNSMFQLHLKPTDSITLGWFFWLWTLVIPILYLIKGVTKKERYFIHIGIALFVASIATIRVYHQLLPIEVALLLAGSILISIGYGLMKYLETPKNNFTALLIDDNKNFANIEALIAVSVTSLTSKLRTQNTTEFGGGSSGGAGATGNY